MLPMVLKDNLTYICDDNIKEGWYRFTSVAGGVMPTECPSENACGMFKLQNILINRVNDKDLF